MLGSWLAPFRPFLNETLWEEHPAFIGWFIDVHSQPQFAEAETVGTSAFAGIAMPNMQPTSLGRIV